MAQRSANLYVRIEPNVKEEAESILSALGINASNAINMFYKQIILHKGIPFDVTLPSSMPNLSEMTNKELSNELDKGYQDMKEGKVKSVESAFSNINKDYNL